MPLYVQSSWGKQSKRIRPESPNFFCVAAQLLLFGLPLLPVHHLCTCALAWHVCALLAWTPLNISPPLWTFEGAKCGIFRGDGTNQWNTDRWTFSVILGKKTHKSNCLSAVLFKGICFDQKKIEHIDFWNFIKPQLQYLLSWWVLEPKATGLRAAVQRGMVHPETNSMFLTSIFWWSDGFYKHKRRFWKMPPPQKRRVGGLRPPWGWSFRGVIDEC